MVCIILRCARLSQYTVQLQVVQTSAYFSEPGIKMLDSFKFILRLNLSFILWIISELLFPFWYNIEWSSEVFLTCNNNNNN